MIQLFRDTKNTKEKKRKKRRRYVRDLKYPN